MAKPSRGRRSSSSGSSSRSSSRSRSRSRSVSRSLSRSHSRSRSASSSSPSRRTSHRKSSKGPAKRSRSPQSKRASPPPKKSSLFLESVVLHIDTLSRNVNEGHLKEIFGSFGEIIHVELAIDGAVNLPRGYAYVEFKARADAEKAQLYMDGAQIDGKVVKAKFTQPPRQKVSPPIKPVSSAAKGDAKKSDNVVADIEKDGPGCLKETSPQLKLLLSPRRRSPLLKRGGSPRRLRDSPPPRRLESPIRHRPPSRGRSPSSPPSRRLRSPPAGVVPLKGSVGVLFEDVLLFLLGSGHLQGGHAVLREDLQSADVVGRQFVGLLVLVQGQYHPGKRSSWKTKKVIFLLQFPKPP